MFLFVRETQRGRKIVCLLAQNCTFKAGRGVYILLMSFQGGGGGNCYFLLL